MPDPPEVTRLLLAWSDGDAAAGDALVEAIYGRLRQIARAQLSRERSDHSLPPTALVHEAYLTLIDQRHVRWQNRVQFFAIAARVMRRILVDHARARGALKRGAGATVTLIDEDARLEPRALDLMALDMALERLGDIDRRHSQIVELRFFGGLTTDEIAGVLQVAPITVKRDWAMARAWLYRELNQGGL